MPNFLKVFIILAGLMGISGCGEISEKELNRIFVEDPEFKETLLLKQDSDKEEALLKEQLAQEKKEADSQITVIKKQLQIKEKEVNAKIEVYEDLLGKKRRAIHTRLDFLKKDLKQYQLLLKEIENKLRAARNKQQVIKKNQKLGVIEEEPADLKVSFIELGEQKRDLRGKMKVLKDKIDLYETELKLIH